MITEFQYLSQSGHWFWSHLFAGNSHRWLLFHNEEGLRHRYCSSSDFKCVTLIIFFNLPGIAVCGSGMGAFLFAPLCQWLLTIYDWQNSLIILAGMPN